MTWLRIEDGFAEHEKVSDLSDRSFRLHVVALCYSARNLTDGRLSTKQLKVCGMIAGNSRPSRNAGELVDAGLWHEEDDGYQINDFLEYNPSSLEVKELRRKRAEAGRIGGTKSGQTRQAKAEASASPPASSNGGSTPNPNPDPGPLEDQGLLGQPSEIGFLIEQALREVA